jgi:tetratricopeptide (TPR) repeat protein
MRLVATLALLGLALNACGNSVESRRPEALLDLTADSLAEMAPYEAYQRGLALGESQRFVESLPYFRRALEVPPPAWQPYCDYAISLFHATHQTRAGWPNARPATRSSYERVAMVREALAQLEVAERLAQTAPDRALVMALRARYLKVWGLAWDALGEYHRAATLDERHLIPAVELAEVMRDPVGAKPVADPPLAGPAPRARTPFPEPPRRPTGAATPPDSSLRPPSSTPEPIPPPPVPAPAPDSAPRSPAEPDSADAE